MESARPHLRQERDQTRGGAEENRHFIGGCTGMNLTSALMVENSRPEAIISTAPRWRFSECQYLESSESTAQQQLPWIWVEVCLAFDIQVGKTPEMVLQ